MWKRFTERARKVIFYAQEEAQKFGEVYVSTEHILLGLIRDMNCTAARMFEMQGLSPNKMRSVVEKQLPRGDARPNQDMTLTPRAKRVIDLAYDEARNFGHNYIGTEHLLLGLIREGDGTAGRTLARLGMTLEMAQGYLRQIMKDAGVITDDLPEPEVDSGKSLVVPILSILNGYLGKHGWINSKNCKVALHDGVYARRRKGENWEVFEQIHYSKTGAEWHSVVAVSYQGKRVFSLCNNGSITSNVLEEILSVVTLVSKRRISVLEQVKFGIEERALGAYTYLTDTSGDLQSGFTGSEVIRLSEVEVYTGRIFGGVTDF